MCVWRNIEERSCYDCCSGKAVSVTYSECMSVALGIQYAVCMHLLCRLLPVRLYDIFPRYLTNGTIFDLKKWLLNIGCVF